MDLTPVLADSIYNAPPVDVDPVRVNPSDTIETLIRLSESKFFECVRAAAPNWQFELRIQFAWKEGKGNLNPIERVDQNFASGDSFTVFGELVAIGAPAAPAAGAVIAEATKIPVLILTGFLGSGKTTLLNYILQEQREKKIAVIENEFGEISIDNDLLQQNKLAMAEQIVNMDNGCMCCTIRGDLTAGLDQILARVHQGNPIDLIVIETTGMADPVPIVKTFREQPHLTQELRLDGILTMADARNLPGRLDDTVEEGKINEAFQQIAFADKIILNKLDLVTPEAARKCAEQIRSINAFAPVLSAVKGRINLKELDNIRAHDMSTFDDIAKEAAVDDKLKEGHGGHGGGHGSSDDHGGHGGHGGGNGHDENCTEDHGDGGGHGGAHGGGGYGGAHGGGHGGGHGGAQGHGQGHGDSRHDTRVNSFAIVREGLMLDKKLKWWFPLVVSLAQSEGGRSKGTLFRVKGILACQDFPERRIFHAVMDSMAAEWGAPWGEGEAKVNKIVFIGKGLDKAWLEKSFHECFEDERGPCEKEISTWEGWEGWFEDD